MNMCGIKWNGTGGKCTSILWILACTKQEVDFSSNVKPLRDNKWCEDRLCLFPCFLHVYVCHTWTPRFNLSVPRWNKIVFSQFQVVSEKWVYLSWCSRITCCISSKTELACHPDWDREINTACWNTHYSGNSLQPVTQDLKRQLWLVSRGRPWYTLTNNENLSWKNILSVMLWLWLIDPIHSTL